MKLINRVAIIILLLFSTVVPSYAVDDGSDSFYIGQKVGIKERAPSATLHLNGSALFEDGNVTFSNTSPVTFNDLALVNSGLQIPTGAIDGYVLTTDAAGNASWTDSSTLPGSGSNGVINNATINNSTINDSTINDSTINNSTINNPLVNNAFLQDPTINGLVTFTPNSQSYFQGELFITTGHGLGKILTSTADGRAVWTVATNIVTNGDDLGNHTATRELNMSNKDISNVKTITANAFNGGAFNGNFFGDGSGLRNVKSSIFIINANKISNNGSEASYSNDFIIGSPDTRSTGNLAHSSRMFFDKSKSAFRAGEARANQWNDSQVGKHSVAFGVNTRATSRGAFAAGNGSEATGGYALAMGEQTLASGPYSIALGFRTKATDNFAFAMGNRTEATGRRTTAFGYRTKAIGQGSTTFGRETEASGSTSTAIGQEAFATHTNSIAIGKNIKSSGNQTIVLGLGNSNQDLLENNIQNSLAVGFTSNAATFFVGPASGGSSKGKVGIGTNTPMDLLHVNGKTRTQAFRMPTGAAPDYVLTSDAVGNGEWRAISSIGGGGDDLGNHTATQDLNMNNNQINGIDHIEAQTANITSHLTNEDGYVIAKKTLIASDANAASYIPGGPTPAGLPLLDGYRIAIYNDVTSNPNNDILAFDKLDGNDNDPDGGIGFFNTGQDGIRELSMLIDGHNRVGIGKDNPTEKLDVDGKAKVTGFAMPTGAQNNYVLTSDNQGNGTWKAISDLPSANMAINDLTDAISFTNNVFMGSGAGDRAVSGTAIWNTSLGINAGNAITTGTRNLALGASSMSGNTDGLAGSRNTAVGTTTLLEARNASDNTMIGYRAGRDIIDGSKNIGIGVQALEAADGANANENIAIGYKAGKNMNQGTKNILIGSNTDVQNTYNTFTGENNIFIGNNIKGFGGIMSNQINIGNIFKGLASPNGQASFGEINGNLRIGYWDTQCTAANAGSIRFNSTKEHHEFCDGNEWSSIDSAEQFKKPHDFASLNAYFNYLKNNNLDPNGDGNFAPIDMLQLGNHISQDHHPDNARTNNFVAGLYDFNEDGNFDCEDFVLLGGQLGGYNPASCQEKFRSSVKVDYNFTAENATINAGLTTNIINNSSRINTASIKISNNAQDGYVLTSNSEGVGIWQAAASGADNLGNHNATTRLNMNSQNIINANKVMVGTNHAGSFDIYAKTPAGNGTRVAAESPHATGFADFVTTTRDNANAIVNKWAFGSTGNNRDNNHGGQNSFYIFQHTDKNNQDVSEYRMHITDTGNVGIGRMHATEKLEVVGKIKTQCIILQDGTEICNKQDIFDIIDEYNNQSPSDGAGCAADGYYHVTSSEWKNGNSNRNYGEAAYSYADFAKCDKVYMTDGGHSLTRTWEFKSPPRSGAVTFHWYRDRTGQSTGSGVWYWFNGAKVTVTNRTPAPTKPWAQGGGSIHEGRKNGHNELRCNYDKPTNHFTCTYHQL